MRAFIHCALATTLAVHAISVHTAWADATDCVTLGECAEGVTWDVQVGTTHTTVTVHHPNEDPVVEVHPNDSTTKTNGHGVSVKPSGGGEWGDVVNCQGTTYGCA